MEPLPQPQATEDSVSINNDHLGRPHSGRSLASFDSRGSPRPQSARSRTSFHTGHCDESIYSHEPVVPAPHNNRTLPGDNVQATPDAGSSNPRSTCRHMNSTAGVFHRSHSAPSLSQIEVPSPNKQYAPSRPKSTSPHRSALSGSRNSGPRRTTSLENPRVGRRNETVTNAGQQGHETESAPSQQAQQPQQAQQAHNTQPSSQSPVDSHRKTTPYPQTPYPADPTPLFPHPHQRSRYSLFQTSPLQTTVDSTAGSGVSSPATSVLADLGSQQGEHAHNYGWYQRVRALLWRRAPEGRAERLWRPRLKFELDVLCFREE